MNEKNMTALICAFSRAYHSKVNDVKIYDDLLAEKILTEDEYLQISENMAKGIQFFNPSFIGSESDALRWIVDYQLSPSPLGRAIYTESALKNAIEEGLNQYIILGSGYDTFSYSHYEWAKELLVFELDRESTLEDKQSRFERIGLSRPKNTEFIPVDFSNKSWMKNLMINERFDNEKDCFISLLGLSYYLSKINFIEMIEQISKGINGKIIMVFDYPDEDTNTERAGDRAKKQLMLAKASGAEMLSSYSIDEMVIILKEHGFEVVEQLTPEDITNTLFDQYNKSNLNHRIEAFDNVNYCLAIK